MAGRTDRQGISLLELAEMFPDEDAAREWFEARIWPDGRKCPRCGSERTHYASHKRCPYRCTDCRAYFSVKTGTLMEQSNLPLRKWVFAIYLELTSLKGVSSLKLHRDIGVTQTTAWFMLHRIRAAFRSDQEPPFKGPVEFDETYVGGKERSKHAAKKLGQAAMAAKTVVAGARDRATGKITARVIPATNKASLQPFVVEHTQAGATVYTDAHSGYDGLPGVDHHTVNHSVSEYVRGMAHTNGVESFWSMLKRGLTGVYHQVSAKHLQAYVDEYAGRHNIRDLDTIDQMSTVARRMSGKRLSYRQLTE